jgi:EAL domain-containing protein (putative c-di-GMP-specific phosphodiesterase class I)
MIHYKSVTIIIIMTDIKTSHTSFNTNDMIMEQGSIGDCAYIIESGEVEIFIGHPNGAEQKIATRGVGTIIGEMALIDQKRRTASVRALTKCTLIKITKDEFQQRLSGSDPIVEMITKVILNRYRDTISRIEVFGEGNIYPPAEETERELTQSGKAVEHLKTASEFKHAIDNNELMLHYQPILDLETKEIKGFEALMRWNHPEKGFMPPNLFIPIAEDSGLILKATDWAIEESCLALKRIEGESPNLSSDCFMSVNFTAIDMLHPDFLSKLLAVSEKTGVVPSRIKIEMTERLLMNNPEKVKNMLIACRDNGFQIAIDDFGTGYSSLSYLHHYPINSLKIDRSFVVQMTKDESALNLVKGIINLAKSLNMSLIAEGVEEDHEEALLLKSNCEMAQGYKYSRPLPEPQLIEFLKNYQN